MKEQNYYDVLGATEDISQDELERLYKRLARQHHPDRGGNAEHMKALNEAYRVLSNEFTRRAYDFKRIRSLDTGNATVPPASSQSSGIPNTVFGRFMLAIFNLMGGLILLFVIRLIYLQFMWPIFLIAVFVVLLGVWKLHEAIALSRKALRDSHVLHRYVWAQEFLFWSFVGLGAYTIYVLLIAI